MKKNTETTTNQEGGEDLKPRSANELFTERIKARYPDRDYESNPDEVYNASMEGYDAEHEKVKSMTSSNKTIAERMMKDPKAAAALAEFMEGKPLPAALKKYFTDEELAMNEGEEGYEEYIGAIKEREAREASNAAMQQEYEDNLLASQSVAEQFSQEKGMSPEEFDTFIQAATDKVVSPLLKGILSQEMLETLYLGMNYQKDVTTAEEVGRIKGKNEKIVENRKSMQKSDGLPEVGAGGSAAITEAKPNETAQYFGKMAQTAQTNDIWERGGMKKG